MKMLYFMSRSDGKFTSGSPQSPMVVCYPVRELKGVTVYDSQRILLIFQSPQSAGTDSENDTSGLDYIKMYLKVPFTHKRAMMEIVQTIDKHLSKNNGFIVMADANQDPIQLPGTAFAVDPVYDSAVNKFAITIDEPE